MSQQDIAERNNVRFMGEGKRVLMLAHGFGCDQNVWRFMTPEFSATYRLLLFDYVGSGHSRLSAFSVDRYSRLEGYAQDVLDICEAYDLRDISFVGHSVSGVIGLLAALEQPERFRDLIMLGPSPCYLNVPPDYQGGFSREDLEQLLDLMDKNYIGWANYLAPMAMGEEVSDELTGELSGSFCSTDPLVARTFANATFFSDYRHILSAVRHPTLLLQGQSDVLANPAVGEYMHQQMPGSTLVTLDTEGHCFHMSYPQKVSTEVLAFLSR
ncbi:alpha/beta fold hydrolase [Halopseudomonas salegens]|uniref:Sigma-B regulation protein RsbQ n=1 Tax=Halopseudomonas salegens TaxID=1434072 RepID=A0A1H2E834_9GAMM|nr:alpha/beta hydrolase [Halopseudomonas salegens]SDT91291.1 sigma-B regulation protein RsbQ [Halopseudomonas salegens]